MQIGRNMDILFIRTPHKAWKLITHWDNFIPPLGPLSIGAYLRHNGFEPKAIDCCINQWGWETTTKAMKMLDPPVVGFSGPITWYDENMRMAKILKELNPNVKIIWGGPFPTLVPEEVVFPDSPIDFACIGEGEHTMLEFMNELRKPHDTQDFSRINGLAYLKNGHIVYTPPRALEKDLDVFPMPAYDLLPIDRYGNRKGMWGDVISVYHSKGCIDQCNFCSCWRSGGKVKQQPPDGPLKFQNCWRK